MYDQFVESGRFSLGTVKHVWCIFVEYYTLPHHVSGVCQHYKSLNKKFNTIKNRQYFKVKCYHWINMMNFSYYFIVRLIKIWFPFVFLQIRNHFLIQFQDKLHDCDFESDCKWFLSNFKHQEMISNDFQFFPSDCQATIPRYIDDCSCESDCTRFHAISIIVNHLKVISCNFKRLLRHFQRCMYIHRWLRVQ